MNTNGRPSNSTRFELRPRRAGELIDVAFRLTKQTIASTWPLLLLVLVPFSFLNAAQTASLSSWNRTQLASAGSGSGLSFLVSIGIGLILVTTVPGMYATHMGRPISASESVRRGIRRVPVVMIYAVMAFFVYIVLMIPSIIVLGLLAFVVIQIGGVAGTIGIAVMGFVTYAGFFVVLLGLVSRLHLGFVALVLEDIGPFAALSRGWRLSAGRWLQFGAIQAGLLVLSSIVLGAALIVGGYLRRAIEGSIGAGIVSFIGFLLFTLWWTPLYTAVGVSMYVDARVRTEALDLHQLTAKLSSAGTVLAS
jgi:membrane-anchored glycerophosphoryl diester phosphodiesterase (GDPDase)